MAVIGAARELSKRAGVGPIGPVGDFLRVSEWCRYFLERFVLWHLAAVLPLGAAIRLANATGFIEAAVPSGTTRIARDEIAASTGLRGWGAIPWVARRLAEPRRSLVYKRQLLSRQRRDAGWRFVEGGDNPAIKDSPKKSRFNPRPP